MNPVSLPPEAGGRQVYRGVTGTLFVTISLHLLPIFRKMKKNNFFTFHVHIKAIFSIYIVEGTSL